MSVNLTIAGTTYAFPTVGENNWGQVVTNWATAVSTYLLQRTGGTFALTNEVDFGANFATKQAYIKSRTANPASAGFGRLARADVISWRNQLNNANIDLAVDSSNNLTWNGVILATAAAVLTANRALISNGSGHVAVSSVTSTTLTFMDATSSVQTQLDGKQASGSYITALTGDVTASGPGSVASTIGSNKVTNAMLATIATAIFKGRSTAGTGNVEDLTVTQATALLNTMTGDLGSGGLKGLVPAQASGDATKFLNGAGAWVAGVINPMTTRGDIIVRNASNVTDRLGVGAAGKCLRSDGTDPSWAYPIGVIQSTTTTDTVAQNTDVVLASTAGGAYTDTLPNPATVGNGKRLVLRKTTADFSVLTITDGTLTTTLNTQNEAVELLVTGGAWTVLRRVIPSVWTAFTPTGSWVSNSTYTGFWRRTGDSVEVQYNIALAGAPTSTSLSFDPPSGLTFDTAKMVNTASILFGRVNMVANGTQYVGAVARYISSTLAVQNINSSIGAATNVTQAVPNTFGNTDSVTMITYPIPVSGWNG